jgi:hypothetical protein
MANRCVAANIPNAVINNQISALDQIENNCEALGGTLSTRVLYGCDDKPLSEYKGASPKVPYESVSPLDYLPDAITGIVPTEEQVTEKVKIRQQETLRAALEQAEAAAKNKAGCGGSSNPAFAIQAFCTKGSGSTQGTVLPPFIVQK